MTPVEKSSPDFFDQVSMHQVFLRLDSGIFSLKHDQALSSACSHAITPEMKKMNSIAYSEMKMK